MCALHMYVSLIVRNTTHLHLLASPKLQVPQEPRRFLDQAAEIKFKTQTE